MGTRKLMLLFLPISIAFLVGGYSGSLLGVKGFFWGGAIGWGVIIAIIDYNFSIIKKMSPVGWIGRMILILTSAVITSTIGDHIILEDTIERKKKEYFQDMIDELNQTPIKPVIRPGLKEEVEDLKNKIDAKFAEIKNYTSQSVDECRDGVGKRCKYLKDELIPSLEISLDKLSVRYNTAKSEFDGVAEIAKKKREIEIHEIEELIHRKDIILEMKLLYTEIFNELATTIMFIMFSLMVICIEILPLLLKSGLTEDDIRIRDYQRNETTSREEKRNESIILRNSRV